MNTKIEDPKHFFDDLGNLHDARITEIHWEQRQKRLAISIDDMNANFSGLPEYKGCQPQTIILGQLEDFDFSVVGSEDNLNIDEFNVSSSKSSSMISVEIKIWPHGTIKAKCQWIMLQGK